MSSRYKIDYSSCMLVLNCLLLRFASPINACVYNRHLLFLIENYNMVSEVVEQCY